MYQLIHNSLHRQAKGLEVLCGLLEEEYKIICAREMTKVAHAEFSIQQLIRQLVHEKEFVVDLLHGKRLREYASSLDEEEKQALLALAQEVDRSEQKTSRQATRNCQLSLGLLDQNEKSLQTLFKQALPEKTVVYGRHGAMRNVVAQGALISGRL